MYHTQTKLDKNQKTEFLEKARTLDMKIQINSGKRCQPKLKGKNKIAQECIRKD